MRQVVIEIASEGNYTCSDEDSEDSSALVSSLKEELKKLPPLSSECCIYRTPERLRKQNVQAYTPQIISLGPFHYNKKEQYKKMEVDKRRYLKKFLDQTGMTLKRVIEFIKERETRIRNSYEQIIDLSSDEFVRIVLPDVIFAFTVICGGPEELRVENDRVFGGSTSFEEAALDMLLLENQLPFFIFVDLFELVLRNGVLTEVTNQCTCIYKHCYETFKACIQSSSNVPEDIERYDIKHIIDLLRRCLLPSVPLLAIDTYDYEQVVPTATQLYEAGVKFKVASNKYSLDASNLLDVQFTKGVLKIPLINVDFRTETIFRNLLAFEQCHCQDRYVSEYIGFMDYLINTPKDVELLIRYKIMVNNLGDNEAASNLFNSLGKGLTSKVDNFYFGTLSKDLINYYNYRPMRKWLAVFRHEYVNNPWKILSIIAAFIILILTSIQTMCSIRLVCRS